MTTDEGAEAESELKGSLPFSFVPRHATLADNIALLRMKYAMNAALERMRAEGAEAESRRSSEASELGG